MHLFLPPVKNKGIYSSFYEFSVDEKSVGELAEDVKNNGLFKPLYRRK